MTLDGSCVICPPRACENGKKMHLLMNLMSVSFQTDDPQLGFLTFPRPNYPRVSSTVRAQALGFSRHTQLCRNYSSLDEPALSRKRTYPNRSQRCNTRWKEKFLRDSPPVHLSFSHSVSKIKRTVSEIVRTRVEYSRGAHIYVHLAFVHAKIRRVSFCTRIKCRHSCYEIRRIAPTNN